MWWALAGCFLPEPIEVVELGPLEVVKLPHWQVDAVTLDAGCVDHEPPCVRTECTLRSFEAGPSEAELVVTLDSRQGRKTERQPIELGSNEVRLVPTEFVDAGPVDGFTTSHCDLVQAGTRVTCRLRNTGRSEHRLVLAAELVDGLGVPSAQQTREILLFPGESREIRFEFDGQDFSGQCEIR
jgi:hypothetical protein